MQIITAHFSGKETEACKVTSQEDELGFEENVLDSVCLS